LDLRGVAEICTIHQSIKMLAECWIISTREDPF
jgi:hypothetical protein